MIESPIKLCASCAPPRVEQLSKYYGDGECHCCHALGPLLGYRLSILLAAIKASAPALTSDRVLERESPAIRFDEEKPPTPWATSGAGIVEDIKAGATQMVRVHRATPHAEAPIAIPPDPLDTNTVRACATALGASGDYYIEQGENWLLQHFGLWEPPPGLKDGVVLGPVEAPARGSGEPER